MCVCGGGYLINGGHASVLVVDAVEGTLGSPHVVELHLTAVGDRGVGSHQHDGAVAGQLRHYLLIRDGFLDVEEEHPTCIYNGKTVISQVLEYSAPNTSRG